MEPYTFNTEDCTDWFIEKLTRNQDNDTSSTTDFKRPQLFAGDAEMRPCAPVSFNLNDALWDDNRGSYADFQDPPFSSTPPSLDVIRGLGFDFPYHPRHEVQEPTTFQDIDFMLLENPLHQLPYDIEPVLANAQDAESRAEPVVPTLDENVPISAQIVHPDNIPLSHLVQCDIATVVVKHQADVPTTRPKASAAELEAEAQRKSTHKRYSTRMACGNCHRQKLRCDVKRPCGRCVDSGRADTCCDRPHQKKGRKRKIRNGRDSKASTSSTIAQPQPSSKSPSMYEDVMSPISSSSQTKTASASSRSPSSMPGHKDSTSEMFVSAPPLDSETLLLPDALSNSDFGMFTNQPHLYEFLMGDEFENGQNGENNTKKRKLDTLELTDEPEFETKKRRRNNENTTGRAFLKAPRRGDSTTSH